MVFQSPTERLLRFIYGVAGCDRPNVSKNGFGWKVKRFYVNVLGILTDFQKFAWIRAASAATAGHLFPGVSPSFGWIQNVALGLLSSVLVI